MESEVVILDLGVEVMRELSGWWMVCGVMGENYGGLDEFV